VSGSERRERRTGDDPRRAEFLVTAALVGLGMALYLPALGVEILRHPLEAKYAMTAQEFLAGHWRLVPRLFGELYPDKPPLYFWATAGVGWLRGGRIDELTARLPAVAGAIATLLVTYRLGVALFGRRAALVSAAVLATSNLFFWYARQGHPDQFLTFFVALAALGLWRGGLAAEDARRPGWIVAAYGAMALGVLSKGLLGLVLPLSGAVACLAVTGAMRRPWRRVAARLGLAPGLAVFLGVVLAWYVPAVWRQGPAYLHETLVHQHLVRYARTWAHAEPWHFYLGEFPTGFLPWVLFLPGALVLGWRTAGPAFRFPLAWFVTGFLFLSLSSGKRGPYLLPLYPAASLMVGWLWDRIAGDSRHRAWLGAPLALLSASALLLAIGLTLVPRRLLPGRTAATLVPAEPWVLASVVLLLGLGALAIWLPWRRGWILGSAVALMSAQSVLLLAVAVIRAPQYEARYPARDLAARVHAAVPEGQPVFSLLGDYDYLVGFYLDRPLKPIADAAALGAAGPATGPRYVLLETRALAGDAARAAVPILETRLGPKHVVLVRLGRLAP
jgi:4-amino-4-deoxy-L-arabinose transferase-like glycosyltransferase